MSWASWSDFFAMGGYALYVWGAVVVILCLMVAEMLLLALRWQTILQHLGRWQRSVRKYFDETEA